MPRERETCKDKEREMIDRCTEMLEVIESVGRGVADV